MTFSAELIPLPREAAESLALRALGWFAAEPARTEALIAAGGTSVDEMRTRAADPEYLGFVLDHLMSDDGLAGAFCAAEGLAPDRLIRARAGLPGGDPPHWT